MQLTDYHVHSFYSFDGKAGIDDICRTAAEKGLSEICFTEHFSIDPADPSYKFFNYEGYMEDLKRMQEKYKDKIDIKIGMESGEPHINRDKLNEVLKGFDLDFIIGSVHNINSLKLRKYMQGKDKQKIYKDYFNEVYETALYGEYDVLGHLDLMKRYAYPYVGNYEYEDYREDIDRILKSVIGRGKGIEINTSGLRTEFKEVFPKPEILKRYRELGGEIITLGSDTHSGDYLCYEFKKACSILLQAGFTKVYSFNKHKPSVLQNIDRSSL